VLHGRASSVLKYPRGPSEKSDTGPKIYFVNVNANMYIAIFTISGNQVTKLVKRPSEYLRCLRIQSSINILQMKVPRLQWNCNIFIDLFLHSGMPLECTRSILQVSKRLACQKPKI